MGHVAHDLHRAATQNIGGADHQREADIFGNGQRLRVGGGDAVARLFQAKTLDKLLEPLAVFGKVDGVGRGAKDGDTFLVKRIRQFQRGLAAELDDHAVQRSVGLFDPQDFHHMLEGQRFEIEPVRRVIVGGHRFRVAVDHDGFIAHVRQRKAGVAAAIIELDPLTDAVGAAAQNDHFLAVRGAGFAFHIAHRGGFIGGIHVRRLRFELGAAGVDPLEHGIDPKVLAGAADVRFGPACQMGQTRVGKAHHLELAQTVFGDRKTVLADLILGLDDFADTGQEPRIEHGGRVDFVIGQAVAHGLRDGAHPVGRGLGDGLDHGGFLGCAFDLDLVKAGQAGFHRGQRLLQRFVDGAANGHRLAHGFHRGGQVGLAAGEFLKGEAGDLGHDIVDRRLEAGRRHLGDVIVQLVQRIADGQFRRDLGNRETRRLGGQRG